MSDLIEKLERELLKIDRNIGAVFARANEDPIWADEEFWNGRFMAMVNRSGELVDKIVYLSRKERA